MVVVLARLVLVRVDVELGAAGSVPLVAPRLEHGSSVYKFFYLSVMWIAIVLIRIRLFPFDAYPDLDSNPMRSFIHVGKSAMPVRSHRCHQFQYFGTYIIIFWEKYGLALHLFG